MKKRLYIKIAFIVVIQIFVILCVIPSLRKLYVKRSIMQSKVKRGTTSKTRIYSYKMIDNCHLFSGDKWSDEEREGISPGDPYFLNSIEPLLKSDDGQMITLLLYDQVKEKDLLSSRYYDHFKHLKNLVADNSLYDGISYMYYDLGHRKDASTTNNIVASLMEALNIDVVVGPSHLDYVVISWLSPEHFAGGLDKILDYRFNIPFIVPPGADAAALFKEWEYEVKNIIVLPPGYHQMSQRVGMLVLPSALPPQEGTPPEHEIDLVLKVQGGIAIIAGEGAPGMETIIREAEKGTGQKVVRYIGATGFLMGIDNPKSIESMKRIKDSHPALIICAHYATSLIADYHMKKVFGKNYSFVHVGTSVPLPNPSVIYRMLAR